MMTKGGIMTTNNAWRNFKSGNWESKIDVRDFIQTNYTSYEGDESFLAGPTDNTKKLWTDVRKLMDEEIKKGGVLDADTSKVSTVSSHEAGYIQKNIEKIVGLQTEKPLKRAFMPYGGIRMAQKALEAYGYEMAPELNEVFGAGKIRKTHNDGVFDVYTPMIRKARKTGIITGLPDAYGRGRIIGDYRRIALYGVDKLLEDKKAQHTSLENEVMLEDVIRLREEISEQYRALAELKVMASKYGLDISRPAENAQEAVQWTYFGYLGAVKEQNGAAMSLGRISTFLDVYFKRDIEEGNLTEAEAQEIVDHFVMKLRMVRFIRTVEYNQLFSGDPLWITEVLGGMGEDGRSLVTKSSFRFLQTLYNLGAAPEPNLTVLWSSKLPQTWKNFCAKVSIETSSIQYENDDLMKSYYGDDYAIACCVSGMRVGKQMQFFGARANLAKAMLYGINGGKDEKTGAQITEPFAPITDEILDYDKVLKNFDIMMDWLSKNYVDALNTIHYMHDKYCYEKFQMSLHDRDVHRTMACGIAGLSVVADSLSAIKYAKVKVKRNEDGLAVDYVIEGEHPEFGNNDDRVDEIASWLVEEFMNKIRKLKTYRNAEPTQSILTITSNVVYGKKTGNTPDGRKAGEPFGPGANPIHGRDRTGPVNSLMSLAKLPYEHAQDGISYTFSIVPSALGKSIDERKEKMAGLLDGYFDASGHHINVNVFDRETLLDAMKHPEKYPQLTIRVSGYAVNFIKLTREQQMDVITRTFHGEDEVSVSREFVCASCGINE